MQRIELIVTLFIALWLHYMVSIVAQLKHLTLDYREIRQIKKTFTAVNNMQNIFSTETLEVQQIQSEKLGFKLDRCSKRHIINKEDWDKLQKEHVFPPVQSQYFPEYGVLFNDHGFLLPGLKKTYLSVAVEIPKEWHIKKVEWDLLDCDEWAGHNLCNWRGTQINVPAIRELIHQQVCADVNRQFRELKAEIDAEWHNLTFQVTQQIPLFVPNKIVHTSYGNAI